MVNSYNFTSGWDRYLIEGLQWRLSIQTRKPFQCKQFMDCDRAFLERYEKVLGIEVYASVQRNEGYAMVDDSRNIHILKSLN
jgi:hypothetical protein